MLSLLQRKASHWKELPPLKTVWISYDLIQIGQSIWISTNWNRGENGMVEFNIKSNKITNTVKYPQNIKPSCHSCCYHNNKIYIIVGKIGEIISFSPSRKSFIKKIDIPKLGAYPSAIVVGDTIHISHGKNNTRYFIYCIKNNTIKEMNDSTTTNRLDSLCVLKHQDKIYKFGGEDNTNNKCMDTFYVSSVQNGAFSKLKWTLQPQHQLKGGRDSFGAVILNHYILKFGGNLDTDYNCSDAIYLLDLKQNNGWIKIQQIECPIKSGFRAILDTNGDVHLFTHVNKNKVPKHYAISIKQVLGDIAVDDVKDNDDELRTKCNTLKNKLAVIDTEKRAMQTLIDELLLNQNKLENVANESLSKNKALTMEIQQFQNDNSQLNQQLMQVRDKLELNERQYQKQTSILQQKLASVEEENKMDKLALEEKLERGQEKQKKLQTDTVRLRQQIQNLQQQLAAAQDECKESNLQINQLKNELNKIKKIHRIDVKNYKSWSAQDLVDWIISLDGGQKYQQYANKLMVSFNSEGVDGQSMEDIDKNDLKSWGITGFKDRTNIYKHIQNVINGGRGNDNNNNNNNQQSQNQQVNVNYNNEYNEGVDGTAFI